MKLFPFGGPRVREGIEQNGVLRYVDVGLIFGAEYLLHRHVSVDDGPDFHLGEEISWADRPRNAFSHVIRMGMCSRSLFAGLLEKRDIPHVWLPKQSYLELASLLHSLLFLMAFPFPFPLLLLLDVLHRYVVRMPIDTWMRLVDACVIP